METEDAAFPTESVSPYEYWGHVIKVVDGDTVDLEVDVGFETTVRKRFRLLGIDTPEMFGVRAGTPEYQRGVAARDALIALIPAHGWVELRVHKSADREKYGRYLGEILVDGQSLNDELVATGHAVRI